MMFVSLIIASVIAYHSLSPMLPYHSYPHYRPSPILSGLFSKGPIGASRDDFSISKLNWQNFIQSHTLILDFNINILVLITMCFVLLKFVYTVFTSYINKWLALQLFKTKHKYTRSCRLDFNIPQTGHLSIYSKYPTIKNPLFLANP